MRQGLLLSLIFSLGCGAEAIDEDTELEVSLDDLSADKVGNRTVDEVGGHISFTQDAAEGTVKKKNYKIGYTFRAIKDREFKLFASDADPNGNLDTIIRLYGPRRANGKYAFIASSDNYNGEKYGLIKAPVAETGIYLAIATAKAPGKIRTGLSCGSADGCEEACITIKIYQPMCGADGHTYGNSMEAACYDIKIKHPGACAPSCTGPVNYDQALASEIDGTWHNGNDIARTYTFNNKDGSFTVSDAVSPCPPNAFCFWSGYVTASGTWYLLDDTVQLVYSTPTTNNWNLTYYKQLTVRQDCDGTLGLREVTQPNQEARDFAEIVVKL